MDYTLKVTSQEFATIWAGLGELPSKHSFSVMVNLKTQVTEQENAHQGRSSESGSVHDTPSGNIPVG